MNTVKEYIEEICRLKSRIVDLEATAAMQELEAAERKPVEQGPLKVGDRVRVLNVHSLCADNDTIGRVGTIKRIYCEGTVDVELEDGQTWWRYDKTEVERA